MSDEDTSNDIISTTLGKSNSIVFHKIYNDYFWLLYKWNEFNELFSKNTERLELLNKSTSHFFFMVQNVMMSDIYSSIARLTDPISTANNFNITFMALPEMIADFNVKTQVLKKIEDVRIHAKNIRDIRNKYLAHTDLTENLKGNAFLFKKDEIENIMNILFEILSKIYSDLFSINLVKEIVAPYTGSIILMELLRDGIEYRCRIYERVNNGDYKAIEEINRNPI